MRTAMMVFVTILLTLPAATPLKGQLFGNPTLRVPVSHAPGLGLQVNKVAFGPGNGEGSTEFIDQLTAHFVGKNVEVLERERLSALLREQNFSLSGSVDRTTAAELSRIVGPAVMVFVSAQRYTTEQKRVYNDWKDRKGSVHRTYIARTSAYVRMSVRSVELASGRIFAAKVLESSPVLENKLDDQGWPEYPDPYRLLDHALSSVVEQATQLYLPWTSVVEITFFDDGACGLKAAYNQLKGGDTRGALSTSIQNVETCKSLVKPNEKALAHAYYNVGVIHFLMNDYAPARELLRLAQGTKASDKNVETLRAVDLAQSEAAAQQRVEERMEVATQEAERRKEAVVAGQAATTLTNADVIGLIGAKLSPALILAKIKNSGCRFDTSSTGLVGLKTAGVSDDVIVAMMECK